MPSQTDWREVIITWPLPATGMYLSRSSGFWALSNTSSQRESHSALQPELDGFNGLICIPQIPAGEIEIPGNGDVVLQEGRGLLGAQPPDVLEIVFGIMGMLQCDLGLAHATVADQGEDLGASEMA